MRPQVTSGAVIVPFDEFRFFNVPQLSVSDSDCLGALYDGQRYKHVDLRAFARR